MYPTAEDGLVYKKGINRASLALASTVTHYYPAKSLFTAEMVQAAPRHGAHCVPGLRCAPQVDPQQKRTIELS